MKWIELLDQMSSEPKMYLHGKVRYHTVIGGLITILSYSAVLILAIFFLINFFDKPDPNILTYIKYGKFEAEINMTNRPYFWQISDQGGKLIDERLFQISIVYLKIQQSKGFNMSIVPTQPCITTNWLKSQKYDETLKAYNMSKMTCVKDGFEDLLIASSQKKGLLYSVQMYITKCTNSTLNNNMCLPQQTIDSYFDNPRNTMMFNYGTPSSTVDHSNPTSPIQESLYYKPYEINPSLYVTEALLYKTSQYDSDDGLIFQDINPYRDYSIDTTLSSSRRNIGLTPIGAFVPRSIFQLNIFPNTDYIDYYKRTYPKLQTVVASISGVAKVITLIGGIFVKFVTLNMMTLDLSNYIIYFPELNSNGKIKTKLSNKNSKVLASQDKNILPCKTAEELELETIDKKNLPRFLRKKESKPEKKRLSTLEAILPAFCLPKTSLKKKLNEFKAITMDKLSTNHLLEISSELEILKYLLLTSDQKVLFDNIKNSPSEKQIKNLRNSATFDETESINKKHDEKLNNLKNDNTRQTTRTMAKLI